jgi:hypothetical protein
VPWLRIHVADSADYPREGKTLVPDESFCDGHSCVCSSVANPPHSCPIDLDETVALKRVERRCDHSFAVWFRRKRNESRGIEIALRPSAKAEDEENAFERCSHVCLPPWISWEERCPQVEGHRSPTT